MLISCFRWPARCLPENKKYQINWTQVYRVLLHFRCLTLLHRKILNRTGMPYAFSQLGYWIPFSFKWCRNSYYQHILLISSLIIQQENCDVIKMIVRIRWFSTQLRLGNYVGFGIINQLLIEKYWCKLSTTCANEVE